MKLINAFPEKLLLYIVAICAIFIMIVGFVVLLQIEIVVRRIQSVQQEVVKHYLIEGICQK